MSHIPGPVLIAYDGSAAARQSITEAGRVLTSARALVLTVWEEALAFVPPPAGIAGPGGLPLNPEVAQDLERSVEQHAERVSREGAALAASAGLEAESISRPDIGGVAETIVACARERGASTIVIGSSGLRGLLRRLEGGTANTVLTNAPCPVLVVHDPDDD